jgi:transcriptional regulator with XRE-family HTH domain
MGALSQIVGRNASAFNHSLCVAQDDAPWQIVVMDTDDKNGGPNNLRLWREAKGWSQERLAREVVPPTTANMIQYLESGERGLSLKWLRRLADALDTTPGHLADHSPEQAEVLSFWSKKLDKDELRQLSKIAEAITKTGTDDK